MFLKLETKLFLIKFYINSINNGNMIPIHHPATWLKKFTRCYKHDNTLPFF